MNCLFIFIDSIHSSHWALAWALGLICGGSKIFDLFEPQTISVVPECRRCNWFEFEFISRWYSLALDRLRGENKRPPRNTHMRCASTVNIITRASEWISVKIITHKMKTIWESVALAPNNRVIELIELKKLWTVFFFSFFFFRFLSFYHIFFRFSLFNKNWANKLFVHPNSEPTKAELTLSSLRLQRKSFVFFCRCSSEL